MAQWIAERPERHSKELEELSAWFAAAEQVPEFMTLLHVVGLSVDMGVDTAEAVAQDVIDVLRDSLRNATTHATSLSPGTKVAILRDTAGRALAPFGAGLGSPAAVPTARPPVGT
jgi:hypothetical protein